jgi:acyl carrier protein
MYRKEAYGMKPGFVSLQLFSYSFDGYVTSIFTPLISGAKVVSMENEEIKNIEKIRNALVRNNITHFISIPPLYSTLIDIVTEKEISTLKVVTLAGDRVPLNILEKTKSKSKTLEIVNEYGVTESSVMSSIYRHQERDGTIKIGQPIRNTRIYILDGSQALQPIGIPGQLCLSGIGLARGYLNNPELTKEKFRLRRQGGALFEKTAPPGPPRKNFSLEHAPKRKKVPGKKAYFEGTRGLAPLSKSIYFYMSYKSHKSYIYKSGDLARWHADSNIEFLGRIDQQVKIRGFRIELGEIENQLLELQGIKAAVVIDRTDESGQKYLCAYFVTKQAINPSDLKTQLLKRLPEYMVPAYMQPIETIPLTPGGKVNRNALPSPKTQKPEVYTDPRDSIEKKLEEIWSEILDVDNGVIGIDGNFFDLGGHSLKATIMTSKIHKELKVKIPLAEVFKRMTIRELSAYIKRAEQDKYAGIEPEEKKEYYELSSAQKRLYFLQQLDLNSTVYNIPLALPLGKKINKDRLEFTLRKLISRHESLRTSFIKVKEIPYQRVHHEVEFDLDFQDLQDYHDFFNGFIRTFDLSQAPLMRSALIRLPDNNHIWIVDMHHIISDGTSHMVLADDFTATAPTATALQGFFPMAESIVQKR